MSANSPSPLSGIESNGQIPSVERLESAGLVALLVYDIDGGRSARAALWPDEAEALAEALLSAAKDVRDA